MKLHYNDALSRILPLPQIEASAIQFVYSEPH